MVVVAFGVCVAHGLLVSCVGYKSPAKSSAIEHFHANKRKEKEPLYATLECLLASEMLAL